MNAKIRTPLSVLGAAALAFAMQAWAEPDAPQQSKAETPAQVGDPISDRWLKRLEEQHWPAPKCLPNCVHVASAQVGASGATGRLVLDVHVQEGVHLLALPFSPSWAPREIKLDGRPAAVRMDGEGKLQARVTAGVHTVEMEGRLADAQWSLSFPSPAFRIAYGALEGWEAQKTSLPASSLTLTRRAQAERPAAAEGKQADFPLFARLTRQVTVAETGWTVHNTLQRLSPTGFAKEAQIALLTGEQPLTPGIEAQGGKVVIRLGANEDERTWDSTLKPADALQFRAGAGFETTEVWKIDASSRFETFFKGIPQAFGESSGEAVFLPFPGEALEMRISLPKPVAGLDWAIESSKLTLNPGDERMAGTLSLALRSLSAQIQTVEFPKDTRIRGLRIGGQAEPADWRDGKLYLQLKPGRQDIAIEFETPTKLGLVTGSPAIKLGAPSVNATVEMAIPYTRWPLFSFGPALGPAVLIWGLLAFLLVAAWGLSRYQPGKLFRLKYWEWLALLAPLCALQAWEAMWVVIAVLAMQGRERMDAERTRVWVWNTAQVVLGILAFSFLTVLIAGVKMGLLGVPDMMVAGGGSSNWHWIWYQDRQGVDYVSAGMISLPMWVWKSAMLVWSFWIASRLIVWGKQAWAAASSGGLWRS